MRRAQRGRIRFGEIDVRDLRARSLEEGRGAAPGVVDDLVAAPRAHPARSRARMPPTVATDDDRASRPRPSAPGCWRGSSPGAAECCGRRRAARGTPLRAPPMRPKRQRRPRARRKACAPPCAALPSSVDELRQAAAADDREHQASSHRADFGQVAPVALRVHAAAEHEAVRDPAGRRNRPRWASPSAGSSPPARRSGSSRRRVPAAGRGSRAWCGRRRGCRPAPAPRGPRTPRGGSTRHSMPPPRGRRAVARGVDVVEVQRQAQQRQQLAGEHHGAAHDDQHQRIAVLELAARFRPPAGRSPRCTSSALDTEVGILEERPGFLRDRGMSAPALASRNSREGLADLRVAQAELDRRLQVAELAAAVVARAADAHRQHALAREQRGRSRR